MRIISRRKIEEFCLKHPTARKPLDTWYHIVKKQNFNSIIDIRQIFPSADKVKNFVVFDIKGTNIRLIAFVKNPMLYIRHILPTKSTTKTSGKMTLGLIPKIRNDNPK